ncbi:MPA1, partial [Symbiodinium natans]
MRKVRCRSGCWALALCTLGIGRILPDVCFAPASRVPRTLDTRGTQRRAGLQPPQLVGDKSDPPVETGRNPQAVATEFAWGIVLLPLSVLGLVVAYLFSGFLSVPLSESLAALISIEDDYNRKKKCESEEMGLRQRLSRWFHWAEPNRRVDFEIKGLPNGPLKDRSERGERGSRRTKAGQLDKIRQRGKDAAEDIAMTVEYFVAGNGIIDDSGSSRMADRIAQDEASRGYPEAEKFAEKALHEGRKALSETVSLLQEAMDSQEEEEEPMAEEAEIFQAAGQPKTARPDQQSEKVTATTEVPRQSTVAAATATLAPEAPTEIFRKDYLAPNYWIREVDLTVRIFEGRTEVLSRLRLEPRSGAPGTDLTLDGEDLKLKSVAVGGTALAEGDGYTVEAEKMTVAGKALEAGDPDNLWLEIEVEIEPEKNTQLSGLYYSGSMYCSQMEAEGFRRFTYFLDRPDVMAKFTSVRLEADETTCPIL